MEIDRSKLYEYTWMPSRIPVRDALVAIFAANEKPDQTKLPNTSETRWYPQDDGTVRFLAPYDDGPYDKQMFHVEPKGWDHTSCDFCNSGIEAMTLCYVTVRNPYFQLCLKCYSTEVANKLSFVRNLVWRLRQHIDEAAA